MLKDLDSRSRIIFFVLLVSAAISIVVAPMVFQQTRSRGQWEATKELLSVTQAPRMTDYPGVTAWLQLLLRNRCQAEPTSSAKAECEDVLRRANSVPTRMTGLDSYLRGDIKTISHEIILNSHAIGKRLCVSEYSVASNRYVVTAPLARDTCEDDAPEEFARWAISQLEARRKPEKMDLSPFGEVHALRAFIMRQDGTLVSRRFADDALSADEKVGSEFRGFVDAAQSTGSPALGSVSSFFSMAESQGPSYTGAYIDVTDLGVVATGLTLVRRGEEEAILAVDIALGTDWMSKLPSGQPRLTSVQLIGDGAWSSVADEARAMGLDELARMASNCSDDSRKFLPVANCGSLDSGGMLAAVRVGESEFKAGDKGPKRATWLVAWMPRQNAPNAVVAIFPGLMLLFGAFAFVWTLQARRKDDNAAQSALRGEIEDWVRLANSVDVALVTIDPNTDQLRFLNAKARAMGLQDDQVFRDVVSEEDRSAYDQFNSVTGREPQRTYTVRLNTNSTGSQWVAIRSRTFEKAVPAFNARENDRLGIIAVLSIEEQKRIYDSLESRAVSSERSRLSSLLAHGVVSLARLIPREENAHIRMLMHRFLIRRIEALTALFQGWGRPLDEVRRDEVAVRKEEMENVLGQLRNLAERAAEDRELRQRLAWGNGVLSSLSAGGAAFIIDLNSWPSNLKLTTLVSGAEFFVFEELLVNSLKYGKPGSTPILLARVVHDADRRWVEFTLRNEVRSLDDVNSATDVNRYGGRALILEACRRLRWAMDEPELKDNFYVIRWRARCIESKDERRR